MELIANVAASFLMRNPATLEQIETIITNVAKALDKVAEAMTGVDPPGAGERTERQPAVDPNESVQRDHIVCLEDGVRVRLLRRHLAAAHRMTPEEYRTKWALPEDYPMVAPDYSEHRSKLAKSIGLGGRSAHEKRARTAPSKSRKR